MAKVQHIVEEFQYQTTIQPVAEISMKEFGFPVDMIAVVATATIVVHVLTEANVKALTDV